MCRKPLQKASIYGVLGQFPAEMHPGAFWMACGGSFFLNRGAAAAAWWYYLRILWCFLVAAAAVCENCNIIEQLNCNRVCRLIVVAVVLVPLGDSRIPSASVLPNSFLPDSTGTPQGFPAHSLSSKLPPMYEFPRRSKQFRENLYFT